MLSSHKRVTILLTANTIFTPCLKIILLFVHQNSTCKDKRSNEHTSGRFCNGGLGSFLLWLSSISASCLFRRYFVFCISLLTEPAADGELLHVPLHRAHRRSSAQQGLPSSAVFLDGVVGVYPQHDYNVFIVTKYIQIFVYILPIQIKSTSVGSTAEDFPVREPLMTQRGLFAFPSERSQLWHQQCCLAFHAFHTVSDSQSVSGPHIPEPHSSAAFLSILGMRAGGLNYSSCLLDISL